MKRILVMTAAMLLAVPAYAAVSGPAAGTNGDAAMPQDSSGSMSNSGMNNGGGNTQTGSAMSNDSNSQKTRHDSMKKGNTHMMGGSTANNTTNSTGY